MRRSWPRPSDSKQALLVGGIVFLTILCAPWLGGSGDELPSVWPVAGVLLGLLIATGPTARPTAIVAAGVGVVAAHLVRGYDIGAALLCGVAQVAPCVAMLWLVERFGGRPFDLSTPRQLLALTITATLVPAVTASLWILARGSEIPDSTLWVYLWGCSATATMLLAPVTVRLLRALSRLPHLRGKPGTAILECAGAHAVIGLAIWIIAGLGNSDGTYLLPLALLWLAVRGGVGMTALGFAVIAVSASIAAAHGSWPVHFHGVLTHPFPPGSPEAWIIQQATIAIMALPALTAAILQAQERRARFQLTNALAAMRDAFAIWGADGRLVASNPTYRALYLEPHGLPGEGTSYDSMLRAMHGSVVEARGLEIDAWVTERSRLLKTRDEDEVQLTDGTRIHSLRQLLDDGSVVYVGRDVTARRNLEAELDEAKEQLDQAIAAMGDAFALFDPDFCLRVWNERFAWLGHTVADLMRPGVSLEELIRETARRGGYDNVTPENAESFARSRIDLLRRRVTDVEVWVKDRGCFDMRHRFTDAGWMLTIGRDVTDRKIAERDLVRTQSVMDDALANIDEGLALFDAQDRLVFCNPRLLQLFPRSADLRVRGARMADIVRGAAARGEYKVADLAGIDPVVQGALSTHREATCNTFERFDGVWIEARPRKTSSGGRIVVYRDVTDRQLREIALQQEARLDSLTGLANRVGFNEELRRGRARVDRDGGRMAVMLIDLDRFKEVNDTYGHATGDALLVEVAQRLQRHVREGDLVARLGGDEFAVLAYGRNAALGYTHLARRLVGVMQSPMVVDGNKLRPGGSIGFSVFPDDPSTAEELVANADKALYAAKEAGRGTWTMFTVELDDGSPDAMKLAEQLQHALAAGQLDVDYQPIVSAVNMEVTGVEALVRWNHPDRGRLPASVFIGAAERSPALMPLTRFVLNEAMTAQRKWRDAGAPDLKVWVNLAPRALAADDLIPAIAAALSESGNRGDRIVLELTETMIEKAKATEGRLQSLRKLGVELALDDFGASQSKLVRLKALPVSYLRIDRLLTRNIAQDSKDEVMVRTIASLAREFGIVTAVEAVETQEQLAVLRDLGCTLAQGYLFAKPMPAEELQAWLGAWRERKHAEVPQAVHQTGRVIELRPSA